MQALPADIATSYGAGASSTSEPLGDGMVNTTYKLVLSNGEVIVVQRLNSIFTERVVTDYEVISKQLQQANWPVPSLIPTQRGTTCVRDVHGQLWRAFSFIPNDCPQPNIAYMHAVGSLLADLHATLAQLAYRTAFSLPHFHDTAFYAGQLERAVEKKLHKPAENALAAQVLEAYYRLPPLPASPDQLIHGDPRIGNVLCRQNQPFTFIDFDTLMLGTIWLDVGDLLRSTVESNRGATDCQDLFDAVIAGYHEAARPKMRADRFQQHCTIATKRIALELCMRFLIDCTEDRYFTWDATAFPSRRHHNLERAHKQWSVYEWL